MADKNIVKANTAESGEMEIDLLDLLSSFRLHLIPIIIITVFGGIVALLITAFVITPQYEATSSIYVVSASSGSVLDLSDLNFGTSLTNDYKKLITSRTLSEKVLEDTGADLTVRQLSGMLTVGNSSGTRILEFTVTNPNPELAAKLANSFANQAIKFLPEVMGVKDTIPTIVDTALVPTSPSNIRYLRNVAIGFLAGFVIAVGIFTVMYMLNDTMNSSEDVEKFIGITPMAMVPENGQKHRGDGYYYYGKTGKRGKSK